MEQTTGPGVCELAPRISSAGNCPVPTRAVGVTTDDEDPVQMLFVWGFKHAASKREGAKPVLLARADLTADCALVIGQKIGQ